MIDFEIPEPIVKAQEEMREAALKTMRPIAREFDEKEHEKPWDYINARWENVKKDVAESLAALEFTDEEKKAAIKEKIAKAGGQPMVMVAIVGEERSFGDAGISLCTPGTGLGGAAINAVGTPEQKRRFFERFTEGDPKWGAMAITEANAGSDTAAITTTAVRDGDDFTSRMAEAAGSSMPPSGRRTGKTIPALIEWAGILRKAERFGGRAEKPA